MSERLRSDFWVSAYLRRCGAEGVAAMLRRRGAAEAGAILIKVDRLDGTATLLTPAPAQPVDKPGMDRMFVRAHPGETLPTPDVEERLRREIGYDADLWIVEVEDRQGRYFVDLAS